MSATNTIATNMNTIIVPKATPYTLSSSTLSSSLKAAVPENNPTKPDITSLNNNVVIATTAAIIGVITRLM